MLAVQQETGVIPRSYRITQNTAHRKLLKTSRLLLRVGVCACAVTTQDVVDYC